MHISERRCLDCRASIDNQKNYRASIRYARIRERWRKEAAVTIPTSKDVAVRAGVSRSTVSQILNGRGDLFAEETRARVALAVRELGYQPSEAGRTLARGSSDIVVALIPNTTFGSNLQDVYESLTEELAQRGLTLVLRFTGRNLQALDRVASGIKPRALITVAPLDDAQRALLAQRGIELLEPDASLATNVNAQIGAHQARFLASAGYRRLAYAHLRDSRNDILGVDREATFTQECRNLGLDAPRILHLGVSPEDATEALDTLGAPGFAVACYNDDVAIALLHAARKRHWAVPADLAVVGMDNTPLARLTDPPLSSMAFDSAAVTRQAVAAIVARLDNEVSAPTLETLTPIDFPREST
jgi:DNA-binding LacI/PurR family transcriptional regulator